MAIFGCSVLGVNTLKCVLMNNQECKIRTKIIDINNNNKNNRTKIIDINNNKPAFYPYSVKINKYSSCNNINDPFAKLCVPDVVKNINVKVFNLMSRTNETRYIE